MRWFVTLAAVLILPACDKSKTKPVEVEKKAIDRPDVKPKNSGNDSPLTIPTSDPYGNTSTGDPGLGQTGQGSQTSTPGTSGSTTRQTTTSSSNNNGNTGNTGRTGTSGRTNSNTNNNSNNNSNRNSNNNTNNTDAPTISTQITGEGFQYWVDRDVTNVEATLSPSAGEQDGTPRLRGIGLQAAMSITLEYKVGTETRKCTLENLKFSTTVARSKCNK